MREAAERWQARRAGAAVLRRSLAPARGRAARGPQVLIETEAGAQVSKLLFREHLLTMLLHRNADLARAIREFEQAAEQLRRLRECTSHE